MGATRAGLQTAAAALKTSGHMSLSTGALALGDSLGFMVSGAVFGYEVCRAVYKCKVAGSIHSRTAVRISVRAGTSCFANLACGGLAFIPVAGLPIALVAGIAWNLCDTTFNLADEFSVSVVPLTNEERNYYATRFHADLVAKAKAVFNFGEREPITKKDLKRRYRQILKRIHPDKNFGELHPCHHSIIAIFGILLTHVEGRADEIERDEILALTAEALEKSKSLPKARAMINKE